MRKAFLCLLLVLFGIDFAVAQSTDVTGLIADLTSSDWSRVRSAKEKLEARQAEALPVLYNLLDRTDRVQLHNTADLIYPGAKVFYGHGFIVDYDLDSIPVRAGWVIESITFQNFGFRDNRIVEAVLMDYTIKRIKSGKPMFADVPLADAVPTVQAKTATEITSATANARNWRKQDGPAWTRYKGFLAALQSGDPTRQQWALEWLRNDKSPCSGLDAEHFERDVRPLVKKILESSEREEVKTQAKLLLDSDIPSLLKRHT